MHRDVYEYSLVLVTFKLLLHPQENSAEAVLPEKAKVQWGGTQKKKKKRGLLQVSTHYILDP